jgi:hypothetical protein
MKILDITVAIAWFLLMVLWFGGGNMPAAVCAGGAVINWLYALELKYDV